MHVHKLLWQKKVQGNSAKFKQFQEVVEALQEFKTYLFIKKGSLFCTVVHLLMKFAAISDMQHSTCRGNSLVLLGIVQS